MVCGMDFGDVLSVGLRLVVSYARMYQPPPLTFEPTDILSTWCLPRSGLPSGGRFSIMVGVTLSTPAMAPPSSFCISLLILPLQRSYSCHNSYCERG